MHGSVSFIELGTSDTERSRPFFERVFGWTFNPMAQGGGWFQAPSMRVGFHGDDTPQIYVFFEVPDLEQAIAFGSPEVKPIRRYRRSLGSVEWPFAATRKAYASVFTSNLATEVLSTADCKSRPSKLSDTELRFHPTQEMRLGAM